jgi:hypothetical protein
MEKFDARAVMAARITEECDPERGVGYESQPMVDQSDEPPAASPSADARAASGRASPSPAAAARSRPS